MNFDIDHRAGTPSTVSGEGLRGDAAGPPKPMDFTTPAYRAWKAAHDPADDDFGAISAFVNLWPALVVAWVLILATAAFFWLVTP